MDKKYDLMVLHELSKRLKGKCSKKFYTCPNNIVRDLYFESRVPSNYYSYKWCSWCAKNFQFLFSDLDNIFHPCPCYCTDRPGEVILHLEQIINDLEKELENEN